MLVEIFQGRGRICDRRAVRNWFVMVWNSDLFLHADRKLCLLSSHSGNAGTFKTLSSNHDAREWPIYLPLFLSKRPHAVRMAFKVASALATRSARCLCSRLGASPSKLRFAKGHVDAPS